MKPVITTKSDVSQNKKFLENNSMASLPGLLPSSQVKHEPKGYQYDQTVDMSNYIPLEKRIKPDYKKIAKKVNQTSLSQQPEQQPKQIKQITVVKDNKIPALNVEFQTEAQLEKEYLKQSYQIKNPHPYGATTKGGNISDPAFPDDFPLVGSSHEAKSDYCNSYSLKKGKTIGCLETHLHNAEFIEPHIVYVKDLNGQCLPGQAVIKPMAYHCSDPECPCCARYWAGQLTAKAVRRIDTFMNLNIHNFNEQFQNKPSKKGKSKPYIFSISKEDHDLPFSLYTQIRHIQVSIPECDYQLPYKVKKKKAETALFMVGAEGAIEFFHPKRWSKQNKTWYYSSHFHFLAVVPGGLVDGQLVKTINQETGYVIKNLHGDRTPSKEQIKTLMYQLSHAGVPTGHQHAVTWIGCLSYNQLSVPKVTKSELDEVKETCPQCNSQLRPVAYNNHAVYIDKETKKPLIDQTTLKPIPIWNHHPILNSKYDQKICLVSPSGWEYIERDGWIYDPLTRSWVQLGRIKKEKDQQINQTTPTKIIPNPQPTTNPLLSPTLQSVANGQPKELWAEKLIKLLQTASPGRL